MHPWEVLLQSVAKDIFNVCLPQKEVKLISICNIWAKNSIKYENHYKSIQNVWINFPSTVWANKNTSSCCYCNCSYSPWTCEDISNTLYLIGMDVLFFLKHENSNQVFQIYHPILWPCCVIPLYLVSENKVTHPMSLTKCSEDMLVW